MEWISIKDKLPISGQMVLVYTPCDWNSTIKPADSAIYGWDASPWAWVIEFERCEKPKEV